MGGIIIQYILSPVIVALMGYIVWLLKQTREDSAKQAKQAAADAEANKKGTMLLLRRQIIADHQRYCINGDPMPSYAYENFCETYEAYKALGGNSMAVKMYNEVQDLNLAKK